MAINIKTMLVTTSILLALVGRQSIHVGFYTRYVWKQGVDLDKVIVHGLHTIVQGLDDVLQTTHRSSHRGQDEFQCDEHEHTCRYGTRDRKSHLWKDEPKKRKTR